MSRAQVYESDMRIPDSAKSCGFGHSTETVALWDLNCIKYLVEPRKNGGCMILSDAKVSVHALSASFRDVIFN